MLEKKRPHKSEAGTNSIIFRLQSRASGPVVDAQPSGWMLTFKAAAYPNRGTMGGFRLFIGIEGFKRASLVYKSLVESFLDPI
jgi:hypothetical protein